MIGMGMVVADDAFGSVLEGALDIEAQLGVDLEAIPDAALGDVDTGHDASHNPFARRLDAADQKTATFIGIGRFGGFCDLPHLGRGEDDQGPTPMVPTTVPSVASMTMTRWQDLTGGPMCR